MALCFAAERISHEGRLPPGTVLPASEVSRSPEALSLSFSEDTGRRCPATPMVTQHTPPRPGRGRLGRPAHCGGSFDPPVRQWLELRLDRLLLENGADLWHTPCLPRCVVNWH
jgi:hypothetical protein